MNLDYFSVSLSLLALGFSFIALWKQYFSPFKLEVVHGTPTFALYKITPEMSGTKTGRAWWIPSFDVGTSFCNLGQKTGQVLDACMLVELVSRKATQKYAFYAKWIVDYSSFEKNRFDRFKWIEDSIKQEWYPFILTGKEPLNKNSTIKLAMMFNKMFTLVIIKTN